MMMVSFILEIFLDVDVAQVANIPGQELLTKCFIPFG